MSDSFSSHLLASLATLGALALLSTACGERSAPPLDVASGQPAPSRAIGPRVVATDPPQGATDVDPARTTIAATFDREMDPQGWAWVIESPVTGPEIGQASWDVGFRTSKAQVVLEPGRSYVVWINSAQFAYFRGRDGLTATPFRWTFSTRYGAAAAPAPIGFVRSSRSAGAPRVVGFEPANGATDVDPATTELRATFDRPMAEGWSWVTEGPLTFPETTGRPFLTADRRTAVLPVKLEPGRGYAVWLNSEQYRGFHDRDGRTLEPVRWEFRTRSAG